MWARMYQFNIEESNRDAVLEWLDDRKDFYKWFTSLIVGCFVVLTVFGNKPDFESIGSIFLLSALVLLLFSILCNFVCVWSIPSWKFRIKTDLFDDGQRLRLELGIPAWLGVISFVSGLTFGVIGNFPS